MRQPAYCYYAHKVGGGMGGVRDWTAMPNCPNCGRGVQGGMKFCPNCGQDQAVLVPQDQRIPTDDVRVPPPPSEPPRGGLLSEKLSTVVMEGLRAAVWGFFLWWVFWIVVFFVGVFYI